MKCKYAAWYRDTCIGDTQKICYIDSDARYIRDVLNRYRYTDIDTKVSCDTYRRYKYLDTAPLCFQSRFNQFCCINIDSTTDSDDALKIGKYKRSLCNL